MGNESPNAVDSANATNSSDTVNSAENVNGLRDKEETYRSEWNGEISQTHLCIRKHLDYENHPEPTRMAKRDQ